MRKDCPHCWTRPGNGERACETIKQIMTCPWADADVKWRKAAGALERRSTMPRQLHEIIAHIRMVIANPAVSTTLIQTEDLQVLCDAAEGLLRSPPDPPYTDPFQDQAS